MKFEAYGALIPNALDEIENKIQSVKTALISQLKRLNYLIDFIKEKNSTKYRDYIINHEDKFNSLIKEDQVSKKLDISKILTDYENLKDYPKLVTNYLNFIYHTLKISEKVNWDKEEIKINHRDYLRAFLLPRFYNLTVLIETIGRDEAIRLYKNFVTQNIVDNSSPNRKIFDRLDDFREFFKKDKKEVTIGVIGVLSEVENGKFYFRKDNCLWADALQDILDKELKYLVCCYGDFQAAVSRSKGNFVLTMKHTIVEGDPFCDCIYHDTNIDWNLTHPEKEFWENIKIE